MPCKSTCGASGTEFDDFIRNLPSQFLVVFSGCLGVMMIHIHVKCFELFDVSDGDDIAEDEENDGETDADKACDAMHLEQPQHHKQQGGCDDESHSSFKDP